MYTMHTIYNRSYAHRRSLSLSLSHERNDLVPNDVCKCVRWLYFLLMRHLISADLVNKESGLNTRSHTNHGWLPFKRWATYRCICLGCWLVLRLVCDCQKGLWVAFWFDCRLVVGVCLSERFRWRDDLLYAIYSPKFAIRDYYSIRWVFDEQRV